MDIKKFVTKNFTFLFVCVVLIIQTLIYINIKKMAQNYRENFVDERTRAMEDYELQEDFRAVMRGEEKLDQ